MYPGNTIGVPVAVEDGYGQLRDADNTPVVVVLRNGIDTTIQATVSKTATGLYVASITLPSDWVVGDLVAARIKATVQGFTGVRLAYLGHIQGSGPTAQQIRAEIERAGGMLDGKASQTSVTALGNQVTTIAADLGDLQGLV